MRLNHLLLLLRVILLGLLRNHHLRLIHLLALGSILRLLGLSVIDGLLLGHLILLRSHHLWLRLILILSRGPHVNILMTIVGRI